MTRRTTGGGRPHRGTVDRAGRPWPAVVIAALLGLSLAAASPAAGAGAAGAGQVPGAQARPRPVGPHVMAFGAGPRLLPAAADTVAPPGAHLSYQGGKVVPAVKVFQVLYGSGTYDPQVTGPQTGAFLGALTGSSYLDWLAEYDTVGLVGASDHQPGSNQTIGRGSYGGQITITPSPADAGPQLDDSQVQAELAAQVASGALPAPDGNTLFVVFFPRGTTICDAGACSMQTGGFCAYHGTTTAPELYYAVVPDFTPAGTGPGGHCGGSPTNFQNMTAVLSHEVTETITDPEVGLAHDPTARPIAWYDAANNDEMADLCNADQGTLAAGGTTYTVQKLWSNAANSCILGHDDVGRANAVIQYQGQAHVWYHDATTHALRHGWWTGTRWLAETLDGPGSQYPAAAGVTGDDVGQGVAVTLYQGQPHVWYYDATHHALRHAWWTGTRWLFETLDGTGTRYPGVPGVTGDDVGRSVAVTLYLGQPHVWYYDATAHALRHGWWTGTGWSFESLDGPGTRYPAAPGVTVQRDVGQGVSVVLYGGRPHVWYYDATAHALRHGWWTGTGWSFETLDGQSSGAAPGVTRGDDVGQYSAPVLYGGLPHVWYYDATAHALRHGWWTGTGWSFETLDGAGSRDPSSPGVTGDDVGRFAAATLFGGRPHVWYADINSPGALRHAWWDGRRWHFETLDGQGSAYPASPGVTVQGVGADSAVMLYGGVPHVWYYEPPGGVSRHGWWTGTGWAFESLDAGAG